jgi:hypothetical protein
MPRSHFILFIGASLWPSAVALALQQGSVAPPPGTGSAASESAQPLGEVAWLRSVLSTPSADSATRLGAAQRLLRLSAPDSALAEPAETALREALRSGDESRVAAVIEAIRLADAALRERLPRGLASALLDAAKSVPGPKRDALRAAFANLGEGAAPFIGELAADPLADEARRLNAVWALESMSHRQAAEALVGLLDPRRSVDQATRSAACSALERLFQRGYGSDETRWREWWLREAGGRGDDSVLEGLRRRLLDLERRLAEQEQERSRLETRLSSLYSEIYLALDAAQRQDRTVKLLEDELPAVREHALALVDRMLQNFESPGEPLQEAMLARLDPEFEPRSTIRARALSLLESFRSPELAERVTPYFVVEQDPGVLAVYVAALQQRPATSDAAFQRLVALLEDPATDVAFGEELAKAIARLGDVGALDASRMARLKPIADRIEAGSAAPAFIRLAGAVAGESVLAQVEALLTSPDRAVRRAAAEVMRQRGRREALAKVAQDEAIYPVAIRAAADPPPSIAGLAQILSWAPPSEVAATDRAEVIGKLVSSLPVAALIEADDLLAGTDWATEPYRLDLLERAVKRVAEQNGTVAATPPPALPPALLVRLGGLLVGAEDPRRLQSVVEKLGASQEAGADDLRFAAAILQQQYAVAEQLRADPTAWLNLLDQLVARGSPAAAPLNDEMDKRFKARLSPDQATRLQAAKEALRPRSSRLPLPGVPGRAAPLPAAPLPNDRAAPSSSMSAVPRPSPSHLLRQGAHLGPHTHLPV